MAVAGCVSPRMAVAPTDWGREAERYGGAIGQYVRELMPDYTPETPQWVFYVRRGDVPDGPWAATLRRGNALTDFARGEIHLPVWRMRDPPDAPRSPLRMLRHELGHWHLHRATGLPLPPGMAARVGMDRLPTAPWWLHEGFAAHVEDAGWNEGRLAPRPVNIERALDLRVLIRSRRCPTPLAVIARTHRQGGGTPEYAVAWGLAHELLPPARRDELRCYLDACRRGFYPEETDAAARFSEEFLGPEGGFTADGEARWRDRLARESAREFHRLFVGPEPEKDWTAAWLRRMAALGVSP